MCSNRPQDGVYLDPNDVIDNISTALLHMIWITTKKSRHILRNWNFTEIIANFQNIAHRKEFFVVIQIMCKSTVDMLFKTSFGSK